EDLLDEGARLVAGPAGQDEGEGVAAEAGDRLPGAGGGAEALGEIAEELVAADAAELVVERPEGFKIEQDEGEGLGVPAGARPEDLEEGPPVVQPRQVVLDAERSVVLPTHPHGSLPTPPLRAPMLFHESPAGATSGHRPRDTLTL